MNKIKKIIGINLILLLVYSCFIPRLMIDAKDHESSIGVMIFLVFATAVQVGSNTILSIIFFINRNKELGNAYLISSGIVLLIGFSSCFYQIN
jgi:hypothetical protein